MRVVWMLLAVCLSPVLLAPSVATAADGDAMLQAQCAGCHDLTGPAPTTLKGVWERKGPDLFYAGNKFRAEWLTRWLQKPVRIRPTGVFYGNHIKTTDSWDAVNEHTLKPHMALSAADARAVTAALMQKKALSHLTEKVAVQSVSLSMIMGDLLFEKAKGCIACHQSGVDYGGLSCPELHTAFDRLQPEYIYSFMKNPQAWDPKIWMPNLNLSDAHLNKLVRYLEMIGK